MALLRRLTGEQKRTVAHWGMELVIVVAGVLIALGVQQWADDRQAHRNMVAAEGAIHSEVREALTNLIWRQVISQCHLERAQRLRTMLLDHRGEWPGITDNPLIQSEISEATGVETAVPGVYPRPFDPLPTAAWNSALTRGALAPMEPQRFARLVAIYVQIGFLKEAQERENRGAETLAPLTFAQQLTPDSRTRMLQAVYEVDNSRFLFNYVGARSLADLMKQLGWNDKAEIDRWIAEDRAQQLAEDRRTGTKWRSCIRPYENPFSGAS